jgi:hypothetical protein
MKKILNLTIFLIGVFNFTYAEDEFFLPVFDVSTANEHGYLSTKSMSETSINRQIRDFPIPFSSIPPVTIEKLADFVVLNLTLENDSRLYEQRREEIHKTIANLLRKTKKEPNISLHSGFIPIDETNYMLQLSKGNRADTSKVKFIVKIKLDEKSSVTELAKKLKQFVNDTKKEGRTYVLTGNTGLSILNPEKYRYEIMEKISEDVKKLMSFYDGSIEIDINGFNSKVVVTQSSELKIKLYIPYNYSFKVKKIVQQIDE